MDYDKNKIIKMVLSLAGICILVWGVTQISKNNSVTLNDYAQENPEIAYQKVNKTETETPDTATKYSTLDPSEEAEGITTDQTSPSPTLVGASLNSTLPKEVRKKEQVVYTDGFYYEPLSENLKRYITGISYPDGTASDSDTETSSPDNTTAPSSDDIRTDLAVTYDDLRYVHIWHINFDGEPVEGELICNKAIAWDLVEIFYELYRNEYHIEKVLLVDEFDGDDTASMEANNTSCFNYRVVEGTTSLSKHAYGLALDINPLYNPYITYNPDGTENVSPASSAAYADRSKPFPYKIDENDLCYQLFTEHGFTWGGKWNSCKDYQHFQKSVKNN